MVFRLKRLLICLKFSDVNKKLSHCLSVLIVWYPMNAVDLHFAEFSALESKDFLYKLRLSVQIVLILVAT